VKKIDKFLKVWPDNKYSIIRYEDLVKNPESEIKKLCGEIGEDFEPEMLEFHIINKKYNLEPKVFLGWKEKTRRPITASQVGQWKNGLSNYEQVLFSILAGETLQMHGYVSDVLNGQPTFYPRIMVHIFIVRKNFQKLFILGNSLLRQIVH
jgi:hypothetical protein